MLSIGLIVWSDAEYFSSIFSFSSKLVSVSIFFINHLLTLAFRARTQKSLCPKISHRLVKKCKKKNDILKPMNKGSLPDSDSNFSQI